MNKEFKLIIDEIKDAVNRSENCKELFPEFERLNYSFEEMSKDLFDEVFRYMVDNRGTEAFDFDYYMLYDEEPSRILREDKLTEWYFYVAVSTVEIAFSTKKYQAKHETFEEVEDVKDNQETS